MAPSHAQHVCPEAVCPEAGAIATIGSEVRALTKRVDELRQDKKEAHDALATAVAAQGADLRKALAEQTGELKAALSVQAKQLADLSEVISSWKTVVTVLWAVIGVAASIVGWHYKRGSS